VHGPQHDRRRPAAEEPVGAVAPGVGGG
jgi:hypothetical protein